MPRNIGNSIDRNTFQHPKVSTGEELEELTIDGTAERPVALQDDCGNKFGKEFPRQPRVEAKSGKETVQCFPDGSKYCGQIDENGKRNGRGSYEQPDGSAYCGQWLDDWAHGFGKGTHADQSVYTGEFRYGCKHGRGTYVWSNGMQYSGDFARNEIHGQGSYEWSDGRRYLGEWTREKMHGHGEFVWANGSKYSGQWANDRMHGHGALTNEDGKLIYSGLWKEGCQSLRHKDEPPKLTG